jgi:WD40 repeat protein
LTVTADGSRLISSAADGTTRLWATTGSAISTLPDTVFSLAWTPDARHIVAGPGPGANGMSVWDTADPEHPVESALVAPPDTGQRYGGGVAVSKDGRLMAVTLTDGPTQLWNIADVNHPVPVGAPLSGPADIVQQVAFSADGRQLAVAANDESVWLWNIADQAHPVVEATLGDLGGPAYSVAFGDNDHLLAAATATGQAKVWAIDDPTRPLLRNTIEAGDSYSFAVTFSPDGHRLAVAGANRQVRQWDLADLGDPVEIGSPLTGPGNDVYWVDYSPDGRTLAAASADRSVWLWNVTDAAGPVPYATLSVAAGPLFAVRFDPTGAKLAAGGSDRSIHQWVTDPAQAQSLICASVGTPMTEQEWQVYLPGQPYDPPCR